MTTAPILVLAATGKTGRRVADQLTAVGHPVRPASRSSATRFDWADTATWAPALDGAGAVYLVPPEEPLDLTPFVAAVKTSTAERIVLLSARHPEQSGDGHIPAVEDAVRSGATPWTILRPAWFVQNATEGMFAADLAAGALTLPTGEGREPFIDADDIAAVAVAALTTDGHAGRTYELSGPDLLTFGELVAAVAEATGVPATFTPADPDAWAAGLREQGLGAEEVALFSSLFTAIRTGVNEHVDDGVQQALGRPPTSVADWAAGGRGETG